MPQEVGKNQRYCRVFYMAPSLIRGGCLLVKYRWSIFHFGNPTLTTALNHFITMLNHSNNELPAISIIFTSRDFGHVIYIFICNMELRDLAASVKHKINLVWPYSYQYF